MGNAAVRAAVLEDCEALELERKRPIIEAITDLYTLMDQSQTWIGARAGIKALYNTTFGQICLKNKQKSKHKNELSGEEADDFLASVDAKLAELQKA